MGNILYDNGLNRIEMGEHDPYLYIYKNGVYQGNISLAQIAEQVINENEQKEATQPRKPRYTDEQLNKIVDLVRKY